MVAFFICREAATNKMSSDLVNRRRSLIAADTLFGRHGRTGLPEWAAFVGVCLRLVTPLRKGGGKSLLLSD